MPPIRRKRLKCLKPYASQAIAASPAEVQHSDAPAQELAGTSTANSQWTGLAVGLSLVAIVGLFGVLVLVLRRKDDTNASALGAISPSAPPQVYLVKDPATVTPVAAQPSEALPESTTSTNEAVNRIESTLHNLLDRFTQPMSPSVHKTYVLPSLTIPRSEAIRLVQALELPYDAELRAVGAAGTFAVFSTDPTELNKPETPVIPGGDTIIVPSGQSTRIRLQPRQVVYGKGSAPNVVVSVSAMEAGNRVFS